MRSNADAITKLINEGMDLTQPFSICNETVLHYWAGGHSLHQEDSLGVVKLLVEKGADLLALDYCGLTPLLSAANGSHHGDLPNSRVLDFLLEREEYSRAEKIEAMELAGAVNLQNEKHSFMFHKAFDYWRKSLHLRNQIEVDDSGFIEKPRLNLKNVQTIEWNASAELEDVIKHPDKFLIQSFFVRLMIFSSKRYWNDLSILIVTLLNDYYCKLQQHSKFFDIFKISWAML